jgi:hypothetical protein
MSSSWRSSAAGCRTRRTRGSFERSDTVMWPSGQYHAGMRWPHHSWRLTFQSWMFSIQSKNTLRWCAWTNFVRPSLTAAMPCRPSACVLTNHCVLEPRLDHIVAALAAAEDHVVRLLARQVAARRESSRMRARAPSRSGRRNDAPVSLM